MLYFFIDNLMVRSFLAFLTAFSTGIFLVPIFIKIAKRYHLREKIKLNSEFLQKQHAAKEKTPTMGGAVILFVYLGTIFLYGNLYDVYLLLAIFVVASFGLLGMSDDFIKMRTLQKGLGAYSKLYFSFVISFVVAACLYKLPATEFVLIPFLSKSYVFPYAFLFLILAIATIASTSHAVNITDGMDGLAVGCSLIVLFFFSITMAMAISPIYVNMLGLSNHLYVDELVVSNAAIFGACLAFLWYNSYPANVFMGDCGALMLGGYIGYIAVASRLELFLIVVGGIFVMEAMSSAIQIASKKFFHRKVFLYAPLHHHFRARGHEEPQLVVKFWICQLVLLFVAMFAY